MILNLIFFFVNIKKKQKKHEFYVVNKEKKG